MVIRIYNLFGICNLRFVFYKCMSKILSIDYGLKRIGLAITDKKQKIVFPHSTLIHSKFIIEEIKKICQREEVEKIIVGLPVGLNSQESEQTLITRKFITLLKESINIPVIEEDERLSSQMAERFSNKSKDEISAMIILESYLERGNC